MNCHGEFVRRKASCVFARAAACVGLTIAAVLPVNAAGDPDTVSIAPGDSRKELGAQLKFIEDPPGALSINDVLGLRSSDRWRASKRDRPTFGFTTSAYWFTASIRNDSNEPLLRLIEVGIPQLDEIDLYLVQAGIVVDAHHGGDLVPFGDRAVRDRRHVFPVTLPAGEKIDVFLRIRASHALQANVTAWSYPVFFSEPSAYGLFYGIMLAMAVYNLLVFALVGQRSYLYLVLFAVSLTLFHAATFGFAYQYLWPDLPGFNTRSPSTLGAAAIAFFCLFTRNMLGLKTYAPFFDRLFQGLTIAAAILALACLAIGGSGTYQMILPMILVVSASALAAAFTCWIRGAERAGFYLVSWILLLVGVVLLTLNRAGLIPENVYTSHALEAGMVFQIIVLLTVAIAGSIRVLRRQHDRELEQATHDPLTGLPNRRLLDDRLQHALASARSRGRSVGLLFLDLDGFKAINDSRGHQVGDELLRALARRLEGAVRGADTVARLGGDEFTVVLQDLTSAADAELVARKLLNVFEEPFAVSADERIRIAASIGVAVYPLDGTDSNTLMRRADAAMYAAKDRGGNAVLPSFATRTYARN